MGPQPATGSRASVERSRQVGHLREELGVAGEVDGVPAAHQVAERLGAGAAEAAPVVASPHRGYSEHPGFRDLTDPQLCHRPESPAPQPPAGAGRHDHVGLLAEEPQRGEVEMIVVKV